jgi:dynein heavy chain, axonemal
VPYAAHDICTQREKFRAQLEHVSRIVRAYNAILTDLSTAERRLFADHLRRLDKRIHQGMTRLTWSTKGVVEFYVRDCCTHCAEVHALVHAVHARQESIARACRALAQLPLLAVDKSAAYDDRVFAARQADHCLAARAKMRGAQDAVVTSMREIYANFCDGSVEVRREWRSLVTQTDSLMEVSLRQAVKKSLQELSRAINGDAKTEPQTVSYYSINFLVSNVQL